MADFDTHDYDVLVIGAGGAGIRAAIEASANGVKVALVCKSLLGKAHTVMAEGGIAAALANVDPEDGWKTHFRDTLQGGKFMNNWRMAQIHAQEAPERVKELEEWGAVWDRTDDGRILQRAFGGHSFRRLAHVGDRTGLEIIRTLQDKGIHAGIDVFMECTVGRLLTDDGRVTGAFAYWRENGRFIIFRAKAVIMATGGIGKMFHITSNSWEYTGDGMGMAYEVGAELLDMEFTQFHPTGMVWPPSVRGILITEAVRGEGGLLKNSNGERFMENYDAARMELSTRDIVAKAINSEVRAGRGSPHGGVFLDISHREAEYIKRKLPSMYHQFKDLADVDITKEPMEVGPTMHYMMGGIRVEPETAQTTVPGLFACGECAGGMHGANRLGGNSLSDLLVFGRRAGQAAADFARGQSLATVNQQVVDDTAKEIAAPFEREKGETPYDLQNALQDAMQTGAGIIRTADDLRKCIASIGEIKQRMPGMYVEGSRLYNPGWHLGWDMRHMITVAEAVSRCALQREESRGGHTREDFPETDHGHWESVNSVSHRRGDEMEVTTTPKPQMPDDLQALATSESRAVS